MKDYEIDEKTLENALTKHQTSEKLISVIQAMEVSFSFFLSVSTFPFFFSF
jgi:hypothetical protein